MQASTNSEANIFVTLEGPALSLVHTSNSVGDFSPPGKCDRMNDMQKTWNCSLLKSDSILLCASSLICIRQKHKIADKIASVNRALAIAMDICQFLKYTTAEEYFSTLFE